MSRSLLSWLPCSSYFCLHYFCAESWGNAFLPLIGSLALQYFFLGFLSKRKKEGNGKKCGMTQHECVERASPSLRKKWRFVVVALPYKSNELGRKRRQKKLPSRFHPFYTITTKKLYLCSDNCQQYQELSLFCYCWSQWKACTRFIGNSLHSIYIRICTKMHLNLLTFTLWKAPYMLVIWKVIGDLNYKRKLWTKGKG